MSATSITVAGTLDPDGVTVRLDRKVTLPPGPVTVTVYCQQPKDGPGVLEVLDRIHRAQQERGRRPPTEEETAEQIRRMREEEDDDERWRQIWSQTRGAREQTDSPDADLS